MSRALRAFGVAAQRSGPSLYDRARTAIRTPGRFGALAASPLSPMPTHADKPENEASSEGPRRDALAPFQQLVLVVRWGVLTLSFVQWSAGDLRVKFGAVALVAELLWTVFRTIRPVRFDGSARSIGAAIVAELSLGVVAVIATGHWNSPLVFCLLPGVVIAGFAQSGPLIGMLGLCVGAVVTFTQGSGLEHGDNLRTSLQWTTELGLVSFVAGVGHRMLREAEKSHSMALSRMSQLTEANDLLQALHRVSQTLPSSLDLDEVLASTVSTIREITEAPIASILLRDDTLPSWIVAHSSGVRLPAFLNPEDLPVGVTWAANAPGLVTFNSSEGPMLAGDAAVGLYAPLWARSGLVGVLAVEWTDSQVDLTRPHELLSRLSEQAAVAIDNARWFRRIRTATADEERTRIARDLHDRVGQSLAYIAFELDRLRREAAETALEPELDRLRGDLRKVVGDLRETLYDLRTEIDERHGIVDTLQAFLDRLGARAQVACDLHHDDFQAGAARSLPIRAERELWRIAQEAITNVERHASATELSVTWQCDGRKALLEIADDGKGFGAGAGRTDSYGMMGIRERAAAIGARLEIESSPGQGTTIRCRWVEDT